MTTNKQNIESLIEGFDPNYALEAAFYQDPNVYSADLDTVFYRKWIYAGHISQVSTAGCYFLVNFAGESIIVNRGKDNEIRAFANVCRHRGSRICLKQSGKVSAFVCPYHAWTYELNGTLRSKRAMPEDFEREKWGLKSVRCSVFHGLIFINLNQDATSLNEGLAPMDNALKIYNLESTKVAHQQTFNVAANWKLAIENFMECYHCAPAHPEYSVSHALNAPADYERMRPAMLEKSSEAGYQLESVDMSNTTLPNAVQHFYNRSAMYDGFVSGSKTGEPLAPLLGDIKCFGGGAADIQLGPVTFAILYPDHAVIYRFLAVDLQSTDMEIIWLVNEKAEQDKDYNLDDLTWLWTVTTEADKTIILNNQVGVNSRFYEPGPLADMEAYVAVFYNWYISQLKEKLDM